MEALPTVPAAINRDCRVAFTPGALRRTEGSSGCRHDRTGATLLTPFLLDKARDGACIPQVDLEGQPVGKFLLHVWSRVKEGAAAVGAFTFIPHSFIPLLFL